MISSRFICLGLGAAALISLSGGRPAQAGNTTYNYQVTFVTPASFIGPGNGDIRFEFDPDGANPAQASITGGNLTYSSGWQVNPFGISRFGDTTFNYSDESVTIYNTDSQNGFSLPVSKWGSTFGLNLSYTDPPGTDPSDFSLTLQKSGQTDLSLFDIQFNPSGQPILMSTMPGVSITSQDGTPALGAAPVPEASTTVSFGVLLALGLGAMALRKKKAKSAGTAA
ncbi:MAG: hypothetical protein ACRYFS_25965 [Janthinobacterium lividum]